MLVLPDDIRIFDVLRQRLVRAQLVRLTRQLAASEVDGTWWKIPVSKEMRAAEADHHWNWTKLVGRYRNDLAMEAVAVQTSGGAVEGALLYRIDAKSQLAPGQGAVYLDRLAAAPRNRPWLVDGPKYQGIGTVLLLAAIRDSYSLGLGGRVWLTSLPSERTRRFYHNRGFEVVFKNEDGTIDFELSADSAQHWLKIEGYL